MDTLDLVIATRSLERILVVAAGALSVYLGYRLFVNMPEHDKSSGKVVLPGGISIFLSRVGPGAFFSLFGAIVIALSFHYGIEYDEETTSAAAAAQVAQAATATHRSFSGIAPSGTQTDPLTALRQRNEVLITVEALNKALAVLPSTLSAHDRVQLESGIADAKLRLLQAVWDRERWPAFDEFAQWLREHPDDPPPDGLAETVGHYRAGLPSTSGTGQ